MHIGHQDTRFELRKRHNRPRAQLNRGHHFSACGGRVVTASLLLQAMDDMRTASPLGA